MPDAGDTLFIGLFITAEINGIIAFVKGKGHQTLIERGFHPKSLAHITGGGLVDNVPRVFPGGLAAQININSWPKIPIFQFLIENLDLRTSELYRTFNMGIGLTIIVSPSQKDSLIKMLGEDGCYEIGTMVTDSSKQVYLNDK